MMAGVRDKVTDLIFRARIAGQAKNAYRETAAVHEAPGVTGRQAKPSRQPRRRARRR